MEQSLRPLNFTKILTIASSLILILSLVTGSFAQADQVQADEEELQALGLDILQGYEYNPDTQEYTFDKEKTQEVVGITPAEADEVDNFLSQLDNEIHYELDRAVKAENGEPTTQAPPLFAIIGAAALTITATVGTTVAAAFADDVYNYGITKACQNFSNYGVIDNFCTINDYI